MLIESHVVLNWGSSNGPLLGKSCLFGLPRESFVDCYQCIYILLLDEMFDLSV